MSKNEIVFKSNCFDVIRLLATIQVFYGHAMVHLQVQPIIPMINAWIGLFPGVMIFFTLSGFLIAASFDRNRDIKEYAKKRFLRIYPALWIVTLISVIIILLICHWDDLLDIMIWVFGQTTVGQFYTPQSLVGFGVGVPNGSLWTISVEVQFYLLLPIFFTKLKKLNFNQWVLIITLCMVINILFGILVPVLPSILGKLVMQLIFPHLYLFFLGVFFYFYRNKIIPIITRNISTIFIAFLFYSFVHVQIGLKIPNIYINVISGLFLAVLTIAIGYKFEKHLKHDISYGIFLIHMIIINVFVEFNLVGNWIYLLISFILSVIFAIMLEKYVEIPIRKRFG